MAYQGRFIDPLAYASVVKVMKRCGKKNCKCYKRNERHEAYGLKYNEVQTDGSVKQHMKYLPKSKVEEVAKQIAIRKAMYMWHRLPSELLISTNKKYSPEGNDSVFFHVYKQAKQPKYLRPISRVKDTSKQM